MYTIGFKKTPANELPQDFQQVFNDGYELDELYWFVEKKAKTETRENVYLMTMISREPRQIVGFEVQLDKGAVHIQNIVDSAPWAKNIVRMAMLATLMLFSLENTFAIFGISVIRTTRKASMPIYDIIFRFWRDAVIVFVVK